ncbi:MULTISPECIES: hypothetical protein [unclassified Salinivibrio]|uniref:hypothetical protein n=1 Tax=unclassified Salinivibrio TaxID=2636825 RepID=UPI00128E0387|nr:MULTISPECIES: hypothetical protein [unclassified Salinivibrio]MPS31762.1 hypothetical protein [Salinivibrio sp. VYel7]MPX93156.1 hypothetical protein [Salinivibrio sp. VYel9]MPX95160.1 hypothetical protein [Salinivibrio sp. VYel6]MPX99374.1 hypothetical protein [Salinivibrio sp. VYel4]MPY01919.1 hypothetical protein [Salinivibrio sp. VYel5]
MKWLETLVSNFSSKKETVADELLHTPKNLYSRTLRRAKGRALAYLQLANRDFKFSVQAFKFVESSTSTISTKELKHGVLFLQSHVRSLESRKSYLVIYAALLASFIALFKLLGIIYLAIVVAAIVLPVVASDRVFMTHRVHLLEDLVTYLQLVIDERESDT